jgi:ferredoxin-NADP reductase
MYKKYKVLRKIKESSLAYSLILQPADSTPLESFFPGQHLLFKFNIPESDIPLFRNYSFSDAYNNGYYRVSVKKESAVSSDPACRDGACSSYIFHHLNEGDILEAKGPQGNFILDPKAGQPVVMFAGGIGITPLLSMMKSIATQNPSRRVALFYGVNDRQNHCFRKELSELKDQHPSFDIFTFYVHADEEDRPGIDYDFKGFIDLSLLHADFNDPRTGFYLCGPEAMMRSLTQQLSGRHIPAANIYTESFLAPVDEQEIAAAIGTINKVKIEIVYKRSGRTLQWDERFRSLLEFSEANDIEINSGCLFGDCGTCLTGILQGEVKYIHPTMVRPMPGECLPCSCIPVSDIVLDI